MHRRQWAGVLALIAALLVIWMGIRWLSLSDNNEDGKLTITALSVGKADAMIIQESDQVLLFDTGELDDGEKVVHELEERGVDQIDQLLITHFDKDHVGGAAYVMEHMKVLSVVLPDYEGDREEYRQFLLTLEGHPDVRRLTEPLEETLGNMQITIYPAEDAEEIQDTEEEYDNDMSLVASISYGDKRFLFTGDIEKTRIRQMLAADVDWRHDWIKMPHHGRYQKELEDLLETVRPSEAVICCSEKNPAEEKTLKLLEEWQIPVWDTTERAVVTVCDGEKITVRNE